MYKIIAILLLSALWSSVNAQRISVEEYIEQFKETAISEMKRSGVPASITLAQGILESESGNSDLVKRSNNHFGIKCKSNWSGESVTHDDDETGECFRAYTNAGDSYRDHSDFLKANKRYSGLFTLDPEDYQGWAKGLKKAGYATNPRYPDLLIKYIEQYNLQQYSLAALNELPKMDIAKSDDITAPLPVIREDVNNPATAITTVSADPDKIISINSTKCVFVRSGTSLLLVANKHKISLNKLLEFNDLEEDGLLKNDQYIYLQKKQKTGEQQLYVVQREESIYDVSQITGVQLKHLLAYNNFDIGERLKKSMSVNLQPGMPTPVQQAKVSNRVHRVAPKEGLYAIAKAYNVSIQELKDWNNLRSDDLKIGQEIIVAK